MSGLTPGVTRRKTFISESSPKATEEFDCSPLNSVEWVVRSISWPSSRWKSSGWRWSYSWWPSAANASRHSAIASRSWTAS